MLPRQAPKWLALAAFLVCGAAAHAAGGGGDPETLSRFSPPTAAGTVFVKLDPLLVPYYERTRRQYVQIEYKLEVVEDAAEKVWRERRRLRDAFVRALHIHAELSGRDAGFDSELTKSRMSAAASQILGADIVQAVFITNLGAATQR